MNIILYTTHCPKCKVLEKKLKDNHIDFEVISDEELMIQKGFTEAPKLEVNDELMGFADAMEWLNKNE